MIRRASAVVVGVVVLAPLAGCWKAPPPPIVKAEGIVRLDGNPLKGAAVRFIPLIDYGAAYVATGVTDESGRFQLTCNGQPGACACENRVLVMEADIPARLQSENAQAELAKYFRDLGGRPLPPRYANLTESPLIANVKADQTEYDFDLTR
jgi:hypothetical protein